MLEENEREHDATAFTDLKVEQADLHKAMKDYSKMVSFLFHFDCIHFCP